MDRVKAIKVLKPLVDSYVDYANISMKEEDDNIVEALEMAIEALDVPDTNVGDMISRQMAIDAVSEYATIWMSYTDDMSASDIAQEAINSAKDTMIRILKEQPTVQPDHVADIGKKVEGDCISRKTALDAFGLSEKTRKYGGDHSGYDTRMLYEIQDTLEDLPAVQPEPHEGHWILYDKRFPWRTWYKCSECGNYLDFSGVNGGRGDANFCPNCGADMRKENES